MKTNRISILALGLALFASGALAIAACSSDGGAENPTPTVHDGGTPNQPDTSTTNPGNDSGEPPIDASLPDVGDCKSDASTCNSCYTPEQNPVNGCSPAAANCIKFDNTRVPPNVP